MRYILVNGTGFKCNVEIHRLVGQTYDLIYQIRSGQMQTADVVVKPLSLRRLTKVHGCHHPYIGGPGVILAHLPLSDGQWSVDIPILISHCTGSRIVLLFRYRIVTQVSLMLILTAPQLGSVFFSYSGRAVLADHCSDAPSTIAVSESGRPWPGITSCSSSIDWELVPGLAYDVEYEVVDDSY
jgi:hypothetical protein